jgi:acyl carrier protein
VNTLQKLQALLARDFELDPARLVPEATLEGLEIDSLRMIEILFSIEEEFGIRVPAEHAELKSRLKTFGELAQYVDGLVQSPAAA